MYQSDVIILVAFTFFVFFGYVYVELQRNFQANSKHFVYSTYLSVLIFLLYVSRSTPNDASFVAIVMLLSSSGVFLLKNKTYELRNDLKQKYVK